MEKKKGLSIKKGKGTPPPQKVTENLNIEPSKPVVEQKPEKKKAIKFPSDNYVALNFKVDPSFRKAFRGYASDRDIPMKDLLEKCFEYYKENH